MTRLKAILADLFVSSTAAPYTQTYAYMAGGYGGHALFSMIAVKGAQVFGLPEMAAVAAILLVAVAWKETRDFRRSRGVPIWRRCADYAVDTSAYVWGLLIATAGGWEVFLACVLGAGVSAVTATVLWDMARPAKEATR